MVRPSSLAVCTLMTSSELAGLHDRQVRGLGALEDAANVGASLTVRVRHTCFVANQPTNLGVETRPVYFLGCRIQPMRGATYDFCATCDFWTLKRDPCIKRYPSGVCPSPARETAPGFSLRGRGALQKRFRFFGAQRRGPKRKRFLAAASPHPQTPKPAEE
jgi:hypothetical protein